MKLLLGVLSALAIAGCSSAAQTHVQPSSAPSAADCAALGSAAAYDASCAPSVAAQAGNRESVDQAVALDGVPVDWKATGGDAFDFVDHVCKIMQLYPGGATAIKWYQFPIPGVLTIGGMKALTTGVPIECPQFSGIINLASSLAR